MFTLPNTLDILTAAFAIVAAILWFWSAAIRTPKAFNIVIVKPKHNSVTTMSKDAEYVGHGYCKDLTELANALRKQSKFSAIAAVFAGASAIAQAISFIIKLPKT